MSWENSVLPMFIGYSGEIKTGILADRQAAVQIDTIEKTVENRIKHGLQNFIFSVNRTVVSRNTGMIGSATSATASNGNLLLPHSPP